MFGQQPAEVLRRPRDQRRLLRRGEIGPQRGHRRPCPRQRLRRTPADQQPPKPAAHRRHHRRGHMAKQAEQRRVPGAAHPRLPHAETQPPLRPQGEAHAGYPPRGRGADQTTKRGTTLARITRHLRHAEGGTGTDPGAEPEGNEGVFGNGAHRRLEEAFGAEAVRLLPQPRLALRSARGRPSPACRPAPPSGGCRSGASARRVRNGTGGYSRRGLLQHGAGVGQCAYLLRCRRAAAEGASSARSRSIRAGSWANSSSAQARVAAEVSEPCQQQHRHLIQQRRLLQDGGAVRPPRRRSAGSSPPVPLQRPPVPPRSLPAGPRAVRRAAKPCRPVNRSGRPSSQPMSIGRTTCW